MALLQLMRASKILGNQTNIQMILPDEVGTNEKLPVIWLLHGLGDNGTVWQRKTNIELVMSSYRCAVIMPDMGRSFYINSFNGQRYWDYLTLELMPQLQSIFPLDTRPEANAVVGNSMGGYGAFKLAFLSPDRVRTVIALSPVTDLRIVRQIMPDYRAIFGDDDQYLEQEQLYSLALKADSNKLSKIHFYQAVGESDSLLPDNNKFNHFLEQRLGLNVTYNVIPGGHDWTFWNTQLSKSMKWLFESERG